MSTLYKSVTVTVALVFMLIGNVPLPSEYVVPLLSEQLVPEAHAIMGVRRRTRRRTAVVVGSAAAAQQKQADAAAQQQAAAQQPAAAAQTAAAVPVGTVVSALPAGNKAVTVGNTSYYDCGGVFYKAAFQGNNLVYVVVPSPL